MYDGVADAVADGAFDGTAEGNELVVDEFVADASSGLEPSELELPLLLSLLLSLMLPSLILFKSGNSSDNSLIGCVTVPCADAMFLTNEGVELVSPLSLLSPLISDS
jgi:hypothetical protein